MSVIKSINKPSNSEQTDTIVDPETIATLTISRVLDERSERFEVVVTDIRAHTLYSTPNRTRAHINTRTHAHLYTRTHTHTNHKPQT